MADRESPPTLSRRSFLKVAAAASAVAAVSGAGLVPAFAAPKDPREAGGPKDKMDTPTITCAGSTQVSISIKVCAGQSGMPAGFSLQWMTAADFAANGYTWDDSEDDPEVTGHCGASFSGNAHLSRYSLSPYECVTVNVGDLLFDNGASTNCEGELECGTDYVFRAFAHADSELKRSDFTDNLTCSTLDCGSEEGCTLTQGYWKTHTPLVCATDPDSPLCIEWPVDSLTLGTVSYDVEELVSVLNTPAAGNGLIALAHQLIAAKLNVANGADGSAVATAMADADTLIGGLVIPPVGSGYLAPSDTSALIAALSSYNEGATGPGHCS